MAGLLIQLKPLVGQLWAAVYSERAEGEVHRAQVQTALTWLKALFATKASLYAIRYFKPPKLQAVIASDASPWGGGALLFLLPAREVITKDLLAASRPWAWMATQWTATDEHRAQAWIADPGGQARWEAYAIVSAIRRWAGPALEARGGLTVVGGCLGRPVGDEHPSIQGPPH